MRLSSPFARLSDRYDAVVVGSGYGGAIAACRLARAGVGVCLLERGRERQPGEYPDTLAEARSEMQVDLPGLRLGSRLGMYDMRANPGAVSVFMGCGLGGTSLVNANVAITAEGWVLDDPSWPPELREDMVRNGSRYYELATTMLGSTPYPGDPELHKLQALQDSASSIGARFYRPRINVTFMDGTNAAGVRQPSCTRCGDCVAGCNVGAKNTTLMNYLPDAWSHGAEIYTQMWVRRVERRDGGWIVRYQHLESGEEPFDGEDRELRAGMVVLAAGSLGSTEILLRSRAAGLCLSGRLGCAFTGNGDVLGFGYNTEREIDGIGDGNLTPAQAAAEGRGRVGPCITGVIDLRGAQPPESGMIIEEGSIPGAIGAIVPAALAATAALIGRDVERGPAHLLDAAKRAAESLLLGCHHGATRNTQTYLVMAHDGSDGRLVLDDGGHVRVTWPGIGDRPVFERIDGRVLAATTVLGGSYVKDPVWDRRTGSGLVTVHPLGGCPMGEDAEHGVVNHRGQVFSGEHGDDAFPDLYVCDGAVVPRSLGVNPLLTISALAERCCALIVEERGWRAAMPPVAPAAPAEPIGAELSERFEGPLSVRLRVVAAHLDGLVAGTATAAVSGVVAAPGATPALVSGGTLRLDGGTATYHLPLRTPDGAGHVLEATRAVNADPTVAAATLRDAAGAVLASGELRMGPDAVQEQLAALRVLGATDAATRLDRAIALGRAVGGPLYDVAGAVATTPPGGLGPVPPRKRRTLLAPAPEVQPLTAADGAALRVTRHRAGTAGPVLLVHGIGESSRLFTIDTIGANLLEALAARGYDVWLLDHRASVLLPGGPADHDLDQVAGDVAAAVAAVRERAGAPTVQAVGHGMGAAALMMTLGAGTQGVRSAVLSQVGAHLDAANLSNLYEPRQLNPLTQGALGEVFGRTSARAVAQLGAMTHAGRLVDATGADAYLTDPDRLRLPLCLLIGAENRRYAPAATERTLTWLRDQHGDRDVVRHVVTGYGHADCLIGRYAARDVYPLVIDHLEATR